MKRFTRFLTMVLLAALLASLLSIGAFALYGTVEVRCGQGHTVTAAFDWCDDSRHAVTHYHCPECDLDYESAPELAPGEAHKYDKNGVCTLCGHACAHTQHTDEYAWKDADCTGTFKCDFCGAAVTLTVTGTYVKDTDAACNVPETGHYEAEFAPLDAAEAFIALRESKALPAVEKNAKNMEAAAEKAEKAAKRAEKHWLIGILLTILGILVAIAIAVA